MKDNFMQVTSHCVSILRGVWFRSYSQSKCAMSDRAHEGATDVNGLIQFSPKSRVLKSCTCHVIDMGSQMLFPYCQEFNASTLK